MVLIRNRIDELLKADLAATTEMVKLELLGGTRTKTEFQRLKSRLESLHQLSAMESGWDGAAELSFDLRRKGLTVPFTDVLIAAIARARGAKLLHADGHFDLIAQSCGLAVESYLKIVEQG